MGEVFSHSGWQTCSSLIEEEVLISVNFLSIVDGYTIEGVFPVTQIQHTVAKINIDIWSGARHQRPGTACAGVGQRCDGPRRPPWQIYCTMLELQVAIRRASRGWALDGRGGLVPKAGGCPRLPLKSGWDISTSSASEPHHYLIFELSNQVFGC